MTSQIKVVVLTPQGAVTFPWTMAGRIAAAQYHRQRGGRMAIGVCFERASRKLGHRLDFDYDTGKEIVDGPAPGKVG